MKLLLNLKFWILVASISIISVLAIGSNLAVVENYFSKSISSKNVFSDKKISYAGTQTKQQKLPSTLFVNKSANTLPTKTSSNTRSFNNKIFSNAYKNTRSSYRPRQKVLSGFNTPDDHFSTQEPTENHITGIDGTGGPEPTPSEGIDGTGGTGTGTGTGTVDIDVDVDKKCKKCRVYPKRIIAKSIIASGALEESDDDIVVNGIEFEITPETEIVIDGNVVNNRSALKDKNGQILIVTGGVDDSNRRIAETVTYATQINGAITQIYHDSITVLDQTIFIRAETIYGGTAAQFSDLKKGDQIVVSGFTFDNGDLSATRIERIESSKNKLSGSISQLNEANQTFSINQLTISYSQAIVVPRLKNGMRVNITGTIDKVNPSILHADSITTSASILDSNAEIFSLQGLITQYNNVSDFKVSGIAVSTNLQTDFEGGHPDSQEDLRTNTKVKIEGTLDSKNNTLLAKKMIYQIANLYTHADRETLSSSTETFQWLPISNAKAYRLEIVQLGNENGVFYGKTFLPKDTNISKDEPGREFFSVTISDLPENSAYFNVHLYTTYDENYENEDAFWSRKIYHLRGHGKIPDVQLTSHKYGDTLQKESTTFTWEHIENAEAYHLRIFDYHAKTDYYEQTFSKPEAVTLNNLPTNGADINVTLSFLHNGWWATTPYDLKSAQLVENATLTSHTNWQQLAGSTETFTWKDVGAEQYEIRVARRAINGWFDIIDLKTFDGSTTSITIDNLPINGGEVLIRLRTKHSGWATKYYTFTGANIIPSAELTSHSNRQVLSSSNETLTWTEVPEAEAYSLVLRNYVTGESLRFSEDYDSFITSQELTDLPKNNAQVSVTLSTKHNGYWAHKRYRLIGTGEKADAKITSHSHYQIVDTPTITVTWDDAEADNYYIRVTVHTDKKPIIHQQVYDPNVLSTILKDLPNNSTIAIGLGTKHGRWWGSNTILIRTKFP